MKKLFFVLLTLLVFVSASFASGDSEGSDGDVTISYSIWSTVQKPGMEKMARDFESKNPGIKVSVEVTPGGEYWKKLAVRAASDDMPDVFWMHTNSFDYYVRNDVLLPLDDYGIDYEPFTKAVLSMFTFEGTHYAVPKDFDTIAMWYNKKLFDEAGVEYPKDGWTWDDFLEKAKALTNEKNGTYGFLADISGHNSWWNFIYQNNGALIENERSTMSKPETVEAFQFYKDLIYKHKVAPTFEKMSEDARFQWWLSGKGAMITLGSYDAKTVAESAFARENFDVVVLPKGKRKATISNGLGYSIAKNSKHKEAAIKFVQYLATKDANMLQAVSGTAIPNYKGEPLQAWLQDIPFNAQAYIDSLDYAFPYPSAPGMNKWYPLSKEILAKILTDQVDLKEGLKEWDETVNKVIDEAIADR